MPVNPAHGPLLSRTALAYLMVVVAALGAGVAYWIARSEQESARLYRQLTRAQMVEISLRQAVVGDWGLRATLEERQRTHRARAANLLDTASRVRASDPREAGQLEMMAQQELMLSRLTGTLLMPFRSVPAGGTTQERIDSLVTDELARLGFSTAGATSTAKPDAAAKPDKAPSTLTYDAAVDQHMLPVWRPVMGSISRIHHHVPSLAVGVVLFVLALVFLTVADLMRHDARLARNSTRLGIVATAGAMLSVLINDVSVWKPIAFVVVAGTVVGMLFWRAGLFSQHGEGETPHPPELEPEQYRGGHLSLRVAHGVRERVVIVMIAVAVLLSSLVAYWYTDAQSKADEASQQAFSSEVRLTNLNGERWLQASVESITPALELFGARLRCAFATQAAALPGEAGSTTLAMLMRDRERDCQALNADANKKSTEFVDDQANFDSDESPAVRVFTNLRNAGPQNPSHLYALADGYISLAEQWEAKSATYVLGLTLFAIALYLLSQSLGMGEGTPSLVLAACGTILALGAFLHAMSIASRSIERKGSVPDGCSGNGSAVERAAQSYGDARAKFESAATGKDYEEAARLFGCALAARPDFGRAQYDRSRADSLIGQGDVDSTYTNFPTKSRMATIRESHRETAASLERSGWQPTARFLNSQGFNTLLAGFAAGDAAVVDEGIAILERGIAATGLTAPGGTLDAVRVANATASQLDAARMLFTNRGLGQLAKGDVAAAAASYAAALDGLKLADNRALIASSLSDLNILEVYCAGLHKSSPGRCKDVLAGVVGARGLLLIGKGTASINATRATLTNIRAWVRPSRVGWTGDAGGFNEKTDVLSVVWSEYSEDWNAWRVVQPLFRTVDAKALAVGGRMNRVIVYDNYPSFCLPPGRYRAEFFLNGIRIPGGDDKGAEISGFRDYRSRELDVAFCAPEGWTLSSFRQDAEGRHLVRAFTNAQNRSALYVFTFFTPIEPVDFQTRSPTGRAWTLLKRLSPNPPSDDTFQRAMDRFTGCNDAVQPGSILSRHWAETNGLVHVALLIGDAAPGGRACDVLESIGGFYDRRVAQLLEPGGR